MPLSNPKLQNSQLWSSHYAKRGTTSRSWRTRFWAEVRCSVDPWPRTVTAGSAPWPCDLCDLEAESGGKPRPWLTTVTRGRRAPPGGNGKQVGAPRRSERLRLGPRGQTWLVAISAVMTYMSATPRVFCNKDGVLFSVCYQECAFYILHAIWSNGNCHYVFEFLSIFPKRHIILTPL